MRHMPCPPGVHKRRAACLLTRLPHTLVARPSPSLARTQGSTSLEHWHINLQFEPVVFEDPAFGVRIHRGVYEAAQLLYEDLLPLVQQHLAASPHATISLSGEARAGWPVVVG